MFSLRISQSVLMLESPIPFTVLLRHYSSTVVFVWTEIQFTSQSKLCQGCVLFESVKYHCCSFISKSIYYSLNTFIVFFLLFQIILSSLWPPRFNSFNVVFSNSNELNGGAAFPPIQLSMIYHMIKAWLVCFPSIKGKLSIFKTVNVVLFLNNSLKTLAPSALNQIPIPRTFLTEL